MFTDNWKYPRRQTDNAFLQSTAKTKMSTDLKKELNGSAHTPSIYTEKLT